MLRAVPGTAPYTITVPVEFTSQAVENILYYCYKGFIAEDVLRGDEAEAVLLFAHRYGINDLKQAAEAYLAGGLNRGNVVRRVRLADECSAEELKTVVDLCGWWGRVALN